MTVGGKFEKHFSVENLKETFVSHVAYSRATGIDNLDQYSFIAQLDDQVEILSRKCLAGTYKFTKYKLKLVSKGRNKVPREISIPTVRDRIALRSLCNFLADIYQKDIEFNLPQNIVKKVKNDIGSGGYDTCIKLDVADFYPSIRHKEMVSRLGKKIRNKDIKNIILSAITSPTVSVSRVTDSPSNKGVPQGLAVSNILAAIYLINIDRYLSSIDSIKYYRYVDDVLILCDGKIADEIAEMVVGRFRRIGLKVYDPLKVPEKSSIGLVSKGFSYLGYFFSGSDVTARVGSVDRLRQFLVSIFTGYKYSKQKSEEFLLWRLNLRITGCIYENKSKGWLFFFSEINDEHLLHSLDHYINKLIKRFDVGIIPKRFVRAFKELSYRKYETNYIPNFDNYDLGKMKEVLVKYFGLDVSKYQDDEIEFEFKKRLSRQVKDLQVDVMDFSYS
ncbi:RNA-dependent DNA polymerase [Solemya pervernicosa gill symbiont]|uniref:RNA-dependent DNA polymerase n=1 Tax=Solemya pervernicosa gill symbiont TaxID=642797 RepID=A0A1T2KZ23_9GAMM|nr:RNA-directed DNA polymerase [Solemya pervernicosa gill symbiont]OOZ38092.1 RNA-dependent DNA polymerase [Solemya pervernicosa gill symbiont]